MTILVTGANGQLGNSIRKIVDSNLNGTNPLENNDHNTFYFSDVIEQPEYPTLYLDITDMDALKFFVRNYGIDVIINCAAYTNVEAAEDNEELAELLNAKAVENLAITMKEVGGLLVHISTDYVFGSEPYNTPCREDQKGTPTGVYGHTKLHGELALQRIGCTYVIIRTSWLYSEYGKNFFKTMLNLTSTMPQLKVVFDQVGTPTYAGDLANSILTIIQNPVQGVYHYSNEGVCSWYDFAKMIAEYSGHTVCNIQPCHSEDFPSKVKRPAYSVLDKTKIKETYDLKIPYWVDSLKVCISNIYCNRHSVTNPR